MAHKKKFSLDTASEKLTQSIGTPTSILLHTVFFMSVFSLVFFGWSFSQVLLILTTILSIEAIYLALFIQMTVNKANENIEDVEESIEDVEKDIDVIQAEDKEDEMLEKQVSTTLKTIEAQLQKLQRDIELLQEKNK